MPGRKSDVRDCQWLQYLHLVGLLQASFRPSSPVCALRSLSRHRASLIENAAVHERVRNDKSVRNDERKRSDCGADQDWGGLGWVQM